MFTEQAMFNPKLERLRDFLSEQFGEKPVNIAFSGGLDSRFLAYASTYLGFKVRLFHISGPHLSLQETKDAEKWAKNHNFPLEILVQNPLQIPEVKFNSRTRCFHCKKGLFSFLLTRVNKLCDGTNHSDLECYRPGVRALKELNVLSPLAEAELSKAEIRAIGKEIGLDDFNQISKPCLLTRFPYNFEITKEQINSIEKIEQRIQKILGEVSTATPFRVREIGEPYLAVHIPESHKASLPDSLIKKIEQAGSVDSASEKALKVLFLPALSGYFDHLDGFSKKASE